MEMVKRGRVNPKQFKIYGLMQNCKDCAYGPIPLEFREFCAHPDADKIEWDLEKIPENCPLDEVEITITAITQMERG